MAEAIEGKVNGAKWAKIRNFTKSQQQDQSNKLKICIENIKISEDMANEFRDIFNQRNELNRCEDSKGFADDLMRELHITPRFTFKESNQQQKPNHKEKPGFLSSLYEVSKAASRSSSMISSGVAEEFFKLIKKDPEKCKDALMKVLQSFEITDVLDIVKEIIEKICSKEVTVTDWKDCLKIFGKVLFAALGPKFFKNFEDEDVRRRMGDKFKSIPVFINFARTIGVDPMRAVLLWFAIQFLIHFIKKVSIKVK